MKQPLRLWSLVQFKEDSKWCYGLALLLFNSLSCRCRPPLTLVYAHPYNNMESYRSSGLLYPPLRWMHEMCHKFLHSWRYACHREYIRLYLVCQCRCFEICISKDRLRCKTPAWFPLSSIPPPLWSRRQTYKHTNIQTAPQLHPPTQTSNSLRKCHFDEWLCSHLAI